MLNQRAFSLVEVMVVVLILSMMVSGGYFALSSGESSWFTTEAGIQVQENLRKAVDTMTAELRQSQFSLVTITDGGGLGSTDSVRFQIPVICKTGDPLLNAAGDVAHWGATLRWGCRDAACMDADNDCATEDYQYIEYEIGTGNVLTRKVLDGSSAVVREDAVANHISDLQLTLSNATSVLTLTVTAQVDSVLNRTLSATVDEKISLRN